MAEIKIYESYYYADIEKHPIGSKWLQLHQLSQWDCISKTMCLKDGFSYMLLEYTRMGKETYMFKKADITESIKEELENMEYKVKEKNV